MRKGLENYRDVLLKQLNEKDMQLQRIGQSNALLQTLACDRLQEIGGLKVCVYMLYNVYIRMLYTCMMYEVIVFT